MTDNEQLTMIENQLDSVYELCKAFAEVGERENCKALYEEYAEWIDTQYFDGEEEFTLMTAPLLTQ